MNTPDRSATLAKALASETGLPEDFASRVAAKAESKGWRHSSWNDFALLGAFAAMVAVCVAGWSVFGAPEPGSIEWFAPVVEAVASQPWLVTAIVCVAIVQMLTFRQRAST